MNTRVVLCTPPSPTHRTAEENLGIGYIAKMLRNEKFTVDIIDGWLEGYSIQEIAQLILSLNDIKVLGISAYRSSLNDVRNLILILRDSGFTSPIVAGGFGPTFYDDDFLRIGIDVVVRGEGEKCFPKLVEAIILGGNTLSEIPGLSWLQESVICRTGKVVAFSKLDDLPFPSRDTLESSLQQKNPAHIVTSRGCYGHCTFCAVTAFMQTLDNTSTWRERSIKNIVKEISILNKKFGVSNFKFVDDSFIEPPRNESWSETFAQELQSLGLSIRFRTQIRADRLTPKIAKILSSVGWFATSIGIESGSPTALKRMKKCSTVENNLKALKILEENHIYTQMGLILFDDETTLAELRENHVFLNSLKWPITKGIFTEMYASEGSEYSKIIGQKYPDTKRAAQGNLLYPHLHEVQIAYNALKKWHKSHSYIYDHAINAISAPKSIPADGYNQYHALCRKLYENDVRIFGEILDLIEMGRTHQCVQKFIQEKIKKSRIEYKTIETEILLLDKLYGLAYDAKPNPFL